MILRAARKSDAPAIAALWNDMIRNTLATFTSVEKAPDELVALIEARQGAFRVAEADGLLGFASFGAFRAGPGYATTREHTIILAPAAQRRGIGRALLSELEDAARAQGVHVLVAGISSANPGAVAFHAAQGFVQTAHMPQVGRKDGRWLDLILMQKTL